MAIPYHNLSDLQFEGLVIEFCVELLGHGVQGFVTGPDGGRDARFSGTAKLVPSDTVPWSGKIVIQAKHTQLLNKSFSESDFFGGGSSSTIEKEIPRIKRLFKDEELDYYILFANRRLAGGTEPKVRKRIANATGLADDRIRFYDSSELDRLTKRFPQSVDRADLNPANSPADFDPRELANVITTLAEYRQEIDDMLEGEELPPETRTTPEEKNDYNGLRQEYFIKCIRPRMVDFPQIRSFLAHPDNQPYVKLYEDTAEELESKLTAWKKDDVDYERQLETMLDRLFQRDFDLRRHKRLTRSVVFYMYCNCDIGKPVNDTAEQTRAS